MFDSTDRLSDWKTFPKKRALTKENYQDIKDLAWFSNNYYTVESEDNGEFIYKDLRYSFVETRDDYKPVFNLTLYRYNNCLNMRPFAPEIDNFEFTMTALWKRVKGN